MWNVFLRPDVKSRPHPTAQAELAKKQVADADLAMLTDLNEGAPAPAPKKVSGEKVSPDPSLVPLSIHLPTYACGLPTCACALPT
eukprot:1008896-Prorocentrum_minimum.AAC.2